jgi:hypothetical protein
VTVGAARHLSDLADICGLTIEDFLVLCIEYIDRQKDDDAFHDFVQQQTVAWLDEES